MLELVAGIISVVLGVLILIVSGGIINTVTSNGAMGDCNTQDYNSDGIINATDRTTTAFVQCDSTKNNGFTILNILAVLMIIGGVIVGVRGFATA